MEAAENFAMTSDLLSVLKLPFNTLESCFCLHAWKNGVCVKGGRMGEGQRDGGKDE